MEKVYLLIPLCNVENNSALHLKAIWAIDELFKRKGAKSRHFNPDLDVRQDKILTIEKGLMRDVFIVKTLHEKPVCSFIYSDVV